MSERAVSRLLVFLPPHRLISGLSARTSLSSSSLVHYCTIDEHAAAGPGTRNGAKATLGQTPIALLPKAHRVDVVFDPSDVFVTELDTPPKMSEAKLRQALPNLLEDRLLADIQDCHIGFRASAARAAPAGQPGQRLPVAVIDRGLLTRTLDVMADCGYRIRAAYSALYTVPAPSASQLCVRVHGAGGVARLGAHEGFAFEFDGKTAPPALQLAVRQLGAKGILAYGAEAGKLARFAGVMGVPIDVAGRELDIGASDEAVNLLQGPFAAGGAWGHFSLPKLSRGAMRLPLIYAGVAAAVYVLGMNAYWLKLDHESTSIRRDMDTAFRNAFPEAVTVANPLVQTQRKMAQLRARAGLASPGDFSVLNAQAAQLLSVAPIGSVASIEYRNDTLNIQFKPAMISDNLALQNTLRAQAIGQGLEFKFAADGSAQLFPAAGGQS